MVTASMLIRLSQGVMHCLCAINHLKLNVWRASGGAGNFKQVPVQYRLARMRWGSIGTAVPRALQSVANEFYVETGHCLKRRPIALYNAYV